MASLVGTLMKGQHMQQYVTSTTTCPPNKKRRVNSLTSGLAPINSMSMTTVEPQASPVASTQCVAGDHQVPAPVSSLPVQANHMQAPPTPPMSNLTHKDESLGALSLSGFDDEILATLQEAFDMEDDVIVNNEPPLDTPDSTVSCSSSAAPIPSGAFNEPDPELVEKLRNSLSQLPKAMQELFVERLVKVVVSPENFQNQVEAVNALALAAAEEAKRRVETMGGSVESNNTQSIELATAVLASFLSKYGAALEAPAQQ